MGKVNCLVAPYIEQIPELVNSNPQLVWRGRFLSTIILMRSDTAAYYMAIEDGRIEEVRCVAAALGSYSFSFHASAVTWLKHWEIFPKPGWHDIFAMVKAGKASMEGDLQPLMANLRYVKEVLAAPRGIMIGADYAG